MKYACIDYGARRVGIAVSNQEGTIAFPRATVSCDAHLVRMIQRMVTDEKIEKIIMGDARTISGEANQITHEVEMFAQSLRDTGTVPVELAREAWSSIEAARYAPRSKDHDDAAAAAIILQRYLDMKGNAVE